MLDRLATRIENRLKLRHYVLLDAIGKYRSVTRVAQQMSLSQPTITKALADIEDIFMLPLFVRTRRGLEPTAEGEVVLKRARLALLDATVLQQELAAVQQGRQGHLRVGHIPYVASSALDAMWEHLLSMTPRMTLMAHEDTSLNLMESVRNRELDCAVCRFSHQSIEDEVVQVPLYGQQAYLVVANDSAQRMADMPLPEIAELSEMEWIFPPSNTPIRHAINAIFAEAGKQVPIPVIETYSIRAISSVMRRLSRGITVLPGDIARMVADTGNAQVLSRPLKWILPPVGLAWLRGSPKAELAEQLAGVISKAMLKQDCS
ncbi:LysR family transcriptional regulator [Diaphorobacter caeni]|uniref:LysR family transcriptional regulator n=1 Tax=Diaphorobacter caeni TaxID=2784387 RepID=UPI00188F6512|nr:LysR substrate-binding domain-containing protein [Diaphorobacter caeni]MBF5006681.1 LysR family transcriptional regulator [Diaphorobacter caeni]